MSKDWKQMTSVEASLRRSGVLAGRSYGSSVRGVVSLLLFVLLWEFTGRFIMTNRLFFAPFSEVVLEGVRLFQRGVLQQHILVSATEFILGLLLAIVVGVTLGLINGSSSRLRDWTDPWIFAIYSTPIVSLAPLFILWLGLGLASKVVVVFLMGVFPILINTSTGVRSVGKDMLEMALAFCLPRKEVFRSIVVPSSLPFILTGIRLAVGRSIIGVVVGEMFGARAGLGYLIFESGQLFNTRALFLGIVLLAVSGIALVNLAYRIERALTPWRTSSMDSL